MGNKTKPKSKNKAGTKVKAEKKSKPEETMDRAALKSVAAQLKGAGSDVKVLKNDTDDVVQRKVNEALRRLPSAEVLKKLEAIDPNQLVSTLKLSCLGVFIDLSDVSCSRCPDAVSCATKFIENLKGGFSHLDHVVAKPEVAVATKLAAKLTAVTRYEAGRLVFVRDVKNPNTKDDDLYDTIERVLRVQPETLGELRAIVERDFTLEGDADFMKFVTALRDPVEGIIKLDVDLTEENKAELRKAGYEI